MIDNRMVKLKWENMDRLCGHDIKDLYNHYTTLKILRR